MTEQGDVPQRDSTLSLLTPPRPIGERHRLVVWIGAVPQTFPVPREGTFIVGRTREASIRIDSPTVSRRHARLSAEPGAVVLTDLESHNGTWLNGERLLADRRLSYGDVLTFGDVSVLFDEDPDRGAPPAFVGRVFDLDGVTVVLEDPCMYHAYALLERLAASHISVLVIGETGTGKELAARALHSWSKRRDGPLVSINCAALPETIAESELFGYERGAFSGAVTAKAGLFESAQGGTVFLDEIGDLSLTVQAKLLRVLENRRITRLGSVREIPVDVRVVSATHRNLINDVKTGRFRQDLYYRLSAGVVHIPPLRARQGEVAALAQRFLDDTRRSAGRTPLSITEGASARLQKHDWPGNVRELKNLMEYVAAVAEGDAVDAELVNALLADARHSSSSEPAPVVQQQPPPPPVAGISLAEATRSFERQRIEAALASTGGNKTRAAKLLGVPLRTFLDKIKRHNMS